MKRSYFRGRIARLAIMGVIAVAYISWMLMQHSLTGYARLDGVIGVLGGLYIASHPAAHFVDMLFYGRHSEVLLLKTGEAIAWITANLLIFFLGCIMITIGTTLFI